MNPSKNHSSQNATVAHAVKNIGTQLNCRLVISLVGISSARGWLIELLKATHQSPCLKNISGLSTIYLLFFLNCRRGADGHLFLFRNNVAVLNVYFNRQVGYVYYNDIPFKVEDFICTSLSFML